MRKKRQKHIEVKISSGNAVNDCVVFMTAYHFDKVIKDFPHWKHKQDFSQLLTDCHIESVSTGGFCRTKKGNCKYTASFDPQTQMTKYSFDTAPKSKDQIDLSDEIKRASWQFTLTHSFEQLLNDTAFSLSCFLTLDSFWVSIKSQWFQVDPIAFFLNNTLFVEFELIDHQTRTPLTKDCIYGRTHNFNVIAVDGLRYSDKDCQINDTRNIPSLILDNILRFFQQLTHQKYHVDSLSYVHNLFVISNSIVDINAYFSDVLGAYGLHTVLNNINTNKCFEYYSQEYLGVATVVSGDAYQQALFDCQLLEALKMFFLLNQIVNLDVTQKLADTVNNQLYLEYLTFTSDLPIITLNALHNMSETPTFRRYKEAIEFKVSYLHLRQEQRKNKNGVVLNILIYILTFISGIGSWQVFQSELGIPFKCSAVVMTTIFAILGIVWIMNEKRK